jgi:hypothetical protein
MDAADALQGLAHAEVFHQGRRGVSGGPVDLINGVLVQIYNFFALWLERVVQRPWQIRMRNLNTFAQECF